MQGKLTTVLVLLGEEEEEEEEEGGLTTVLVLLGDDTLATLATAPPAPGFSHLSLELPATQSFMIFFLNPGLCCILIKCLFFN